MKFIPILFSTPMVQAIKEGCKTQTRRVIKSRHESGLFQVCTNVATGRVTAIESLDWDERNCEKDIFCPYGQPGDILWVRETVIETLPLTKNGIVTEYVYKADGEFVPGAKWKPSIFMPKAACRLFLKVKSVRVERLQNISEADAKAEGAPGIICQIVGDASGGGYTSWVEGFKDIWQKINGADSWDANPWVWVVEFEKIEKPEGFL